MSSGKKTLLLILSILPLILFGIFIVYIIDWAMDLASTIPQNSNDPSAVMPFIGDYLKMVFALAFPAGLISLGLLIYYIIQIVNNKAMETGERVVWIITLIIFCPLTFLIYWLMRVRTLPPPGTPPAQPVQPVYPTGPTYS